MVINTNISSLTAQEASKNTNNTLTSSLEKLSTGLKINKASDDASGLAIADKLRTQQTSINQGVANGNSAVTLLQIADKSMSEQSNILDTIKAKLIQANTDTTSDDGRESIRKDINKLLEQLDNIAEQTNYNGKVLLQASAGSTAADKASSTSLTFQVGETKNDTISNAAIQANTSGLGGGAEEIVTGQGLAAGETLKVKDSDATGQSIILSGSVDDIVAADGTVTQSANSVATSVEVSGVVGKITATAAAVTITSDDADTITALDLMVAGGDGTTAAILYKDPATSEYTLLADETIDFGDLNAKLEMKQVGAVANSIKIETAETISITNNSISGELDIAGTNLVGGETLATLKDLGAGELTKDLAATFQGVVDTALTELNGFRGDIGSTQNQVESAVRNLMTQSTNVAAAESIIRDVDYAEESANFNKQNIISQAGSYAISQANTVQQNVLKLLQ